MNSYPFSACGQMVLLESPELAAALSALSQMEQEIIFLYYFQRLTHREIGQRYGRAGNTTGRRIQMILQQLRAELEGLSYAPHRVQGKTGTDSIIYPAHFFRSKKCSK